MLHSIYDLTTFCRETTGDVPQKLIVCFSVPLKAIAATTHIQGALYNNGWFKDVSVCASTISKAISQRDELNKRAAVWFRNEELLPTSMFLTWRPSYGNKYPIFPRNMSHLLVTSIAQIRVRATILILEVSAQFMQGTTI
jgi:hypothetical protein